MTGVINVITKSPRELAQDGAGNSVTVGFGGFNRDVTGNDESAGTLFYVNGSHAQAVDDKWSYNCQPAIHPGRAAASGRIPAERHAVSAVCQHRHVAAEVRRPRGLRAGGRRQDDVRRWRRRDGRHYSQRHRTLRRGQFLASDLCDGALRGRPAAGVLHQPAERRRRQSSPSVPIAFRSRWRSTPRRSTSRPAICRPSAPGTP